MVKSCCAVGCCNRFFKGCVLKFYRFPTDPERRLRWVAALDRKNWTPNEHTWICSAHFIRGMKSDDPTCPDYVPSIFGYTDSPKKRKAERSMAQYDRRKDTKKKRIESAKRQEASEALLLLQSTVKSVSNAREQQTEDNQQNDHEKVPVGVSVMTDMSMSCISGLEEEVQRLREENQQLKNALELEKLTEKAFKTFPSNKIKYFTGLPSFIRLMAIFNFHRTICS